MINQKRAENIHIKGLPYITYIHKTEVTTQKMKNVDGYEFDTNEDLHTVFVKKDGEIVGSFTSTELKHKGLIE